MHYLKKQQKLVDWMNPYYFQRIVNYVKRIEEHPPACFTGKRFVFINPEGKIFPCCRIHPKKAETYKITMNYQENKDLIINKMLKIKDMKPHSCNFCLHGHNSRIVFEEILNQRQGNYV